VRFLASLLLVALAPHDAIAPKDAWTEFRGGTARVGVSAAEIPDELELLWSFEAGFSIDSSAAIVGGVVYMTALPGLVAALDLDDGAVVWQRDFGDENDLFGESSPTVVDGVVYVGDLMGTIHAFDAESGETVDVRERDALYYHVYDLTAWLEIVLVSGCCGEPVDAAYAYLERRLQTGDVDGEFSDSQVPLDAARAASGFAAYMESSFDERRADRARLTWSTLHRDAPLSAAVEALLADPVADATRFAAIRRALWQRP